jgi:hypothetical protein
LEWIDRLGPDAWKLAAAPEITASVVSWTLHSAELQCSRGSKPFLVEDVADQAYHCLPVDSSIRQNEENRRQLPK